MRSISRPFSKAGRLLEANGPVFSALFRNSILFLGIFGLSFLYMAFAKFGIGPFQNVVVPSILVILGSMVLVGTRALTITSIDYYFLGFIFFAFVSHIYADEYLYRQLGLKELGDNLTYILTMALLFRAFYCLTYIAPQLGAKFFMVAGLSITGFISILGILQRFGPGKAAAVHVGAVLGGGQMVIDAAQYGRPAGVFTNPNILGYAASIFACFAIAWGLADLRNLKPWKTASVIVMLCIAILCTIAAQSRQSFVVILLTPVVFAVGVRRLSKDPLNMAVVGVMVAVAAFALTTALATSNSTYLVSIAHTGVKHDQSVQARANEFKKLQSVSSDIAIAGSGQSMSNVNISAQMAEHSRFTGDEIDSEWGNMFEAFGVWGPLLLAYFYLATGRDIRELWQINSPEVRMIALTGLFLLGLNMSLTFSAVRVSKYESAGFTFEVLGALAGLRIYGIEKGLIRNRITQKVKLKKAAAS